MKQRANILCFYLVVLLFLFLPFSAWIVSLSGKPSLSLVRDGLILLAFLSSIKMLDNTARKQKLVWVLGTFAFWGILSFFWREASVAQWMRGMRFDFLPLVLFATLLICRVSCEQQRLLWRVVIGIGAIVGVLAVLEAIGIKIPLSTQYSGPGALTEINYVGDWSQVRLRSILVNPNALGLYMLCLVACTYAYLRTWWRYLLMSFFSLVLVLTFSRSALVGLAVLLALIAGSYLRTKIGLAKTLVIFILLAMIVTVGISRLTKSEDLQNLITHGDSSSLRWQQYERIWQQKFDIGLLGRGAGGAGLSSQNRLDGGPNRWTEDIYLDMFETYGLIGLVLYLIIIVQLYKGSRGLESVEAKSAFWILCSFSIAGIFVNYYVGQVGIYLFWLMQGLALSHDRSSVPSFKNN